MARRCTYVLLDVGDLERDNYHVQSVIVTTLKAAEVRSAVSAGLLEEVVGIPGFFSDREGALQLHSGWAIQITRTKPVGRSTVARRVKHELHALHAGGPEDGAANGLTVAEVAREDGSLLHMPFDSPNHAGLHSLHLRLHLVDKPMVHVAVERQRPFALRRCLAPLVECTPLGGEMGLELLLPPRNGLLGLLGLPFQPHLCCTALDRLSCFSTDSRNFLASGGELTLEIFGLSHQLGLVSGDRL
mmetsp:Transcript_45115/g.125101  ORF Transcript_45115/g.125101 Transcript_45115/m.125101 type:complete len:244 (+) Transcript_45115:592-1323(+)